ncbi:MAG TPA: tetratricopeptide repeat protein [Candidatus Polarisedimenticolia bacterium]|nr:tetratricopeptide repeat protein [Candidatus Polarisedimenticolia bacterium]
MSGTKGGGGRAGIRLILVVALAVTAFACATTGGGQVQSDLDSLQEQIRDIRKEQASLADQVSRATAGPRAAVAEPQPGVDVTETRLRLDALQRDLQALTLRVEQSEGRLGVLAQELRSTREALQTLAQSLPASPPAPPVAGGPLPGGGSQAPVTPPATDQTSDALYRQAYLDYSKGNFAPALLELGECLRLDPSGPLADDAQYLIGEVQFSQQHFPEAIAAFDQVIQLFPGGDKAPSAYLKKGLALLELNRTADAVIQLQHVVSAYPRSEEARQARERLRGLGLKER